MRKNINKKTFNTYIDILKFILFLVYATYIFFVDTYYILGSIAIINIIISFIAKVNFKKALKNIFGIGIFILFTALINLLLDSARSAMLVAIRLILVCNITYIFSYILTPVRLAIVIEKILTPLKLFKVNPQDISVIICIAIAFIPILTNEAHQISYSLKSKGAKNLIFKPKYLLSPLFMSVIAKINEVSDSLKSKAYVED